VAGFRGAQAAAARPAALPPDRTEHVGDAARGAVYALAAVPIGVGLWFIPWKLAWVAALGASGTAVGAARLYLTGGRGRRRFSGRRKGLRK
jgi:hypothetical protein